MKFSHLAAAAALALVAYHNLPARKPSVDPVVVGSIAPSVPGAERFLLQLGGHDSGCIVTVAPGDDDGRRLTLGRACAVHAPVLAGARTWQDRADGSVAFAREDGRVVAEFAVADGAAFESYVPRQPIMTLLER